MYQKMPPMVYRAGLPTNHNRCLDLGTRFPSGSEIHNTFVSSVPSSERDSSVGEHGTAGENTLKQLNCSLTH